jgi:hypothetical protein
MVVSSTTSEKKGFFQDRGAVCLSVAAGTRSEQYRNQ